MVAECKEKYKEELKIYEGLSEKQNHLFKEAENAKVCNINSMFL